MESHRHDVSVQPSCFPGSGFQFTLSKEPTESWSISLYPQSVLLCACLGLLHSLKQAQIALHNALNFFFRKLVWHVLFHPQHSGKHYIRSNKERSKSSSLLTGQPISISNCLIHSWGEHRRFVKQWVS